MTRKHVHSPAFRALFIVLTMLFMWGFGLSALLVLMNISIGFADTDAGFRKAFLEQTDDEKVEDVINYAETYLRSLNSPREGFESALKSYEMQFSPDNTNYRFVITDSNGKVLLQNAPDYNPNADVMASAVKNITLTKGELHYQIQKYFDDPLKSFNAIIYDDNSQYLMTPSEFDIWFFTDDAVDAAFHNDLSVLTYDDLYTDWKFFRTETEANTYDYESEYGSGVTWEILSYSGINPADPAQFHPASAEAGTAPQNSEPERAEGGTEVSGTDAAEDDSQGQVVVLVSAYRSIQESRIKLQKYYELKNAGTKITASDPALEQKLMKGLMITIRGQRIESESCNLVTYLPVQLTVHDNIRTNYAVFHSLFRRGEHAVVLLFACLVLTVICSIVMCSCAGYTDGTDRITASRIHGIFYELIWLLPPAATILAAMAMQGFSNEVASYRMIAIFCAGMVLVIAACCTFWLYTTAIRAKNGTFWTSFGFVRLFRFFFSLFRTNLLTTFAAVGYLFFLFALHLMVHRLNLLMLPLMIVDLITLIGVAYCIYSYFELHRHVRHMENGDFEPTEHPVQLGGDFASFDCSLNEITDRVGEIVAQQTRADHLRTELITNVSHDLKTPLTSIVNYVDLLSREPMQTDAAAEYLDVLKRQAARLKKLTIDLVDASKASTGNLTVELVPTNIPVLLSQLAGEYEEQLAAKDMTLILNVPDEPITILADGRQIWRVFDNLLNNAYKYTLPGTRIYLEVQTEEDSVRITVKNISAAPLNISADALMERFVRGDSSRHTEGSGLGLSIARDLTKLQNGVLELKTDGDLFKAILHFPLYHAPEPPAEEQDDAAQPADEAPDADAPADDKPDAQP